MDAPLTSFQSNRHEFGCGNVQGRIRALRAEIAASENKIARTREAIATRRKALLRLEASVALQGNVRPAAPKNG